MADFLWMAPRKNELPIPEGFPKGKRLLDTKGVAAVLGVSIREIDRMIERGQLPVPKKLGTQRRWLEKDIIAFIDKL
ncbi:helix-turn-helix transcriptional regulator [Bremerella sp. P1]|uniref:helix-turn-helix transcriptional regulator n=1 Tax=Bremerella sp. P1 TaxID=3026424 RepID=UPI00236769CD|nr:helix-turn-helix domain-containing protein [Bremerella sp. P1]WDI43366.1 helix-turn-helix domain-containing protein [Bremerella sp. P1]